MKISGTILFQGSRPSSVAGRKQYRDQLNERIAKVHNVSRDLGKSLKSMRPNLVQSLINSSYADVAESEPTKQVLARLERATKELTAERRVFTVGIWDLNAMVNGLEGLLQDLNFAQTKLAFFKIVAAIPAGLISDRERVRAWIKSHKQPLNQADLKELEENTIAEDYYPQAEKVRRDMGLDYLVGITRSMIAFKDSRNIQWNYFSTYEKRTVLVSSYGLQQYAARAGRPFEVAVAGVVISELLAALSPKLKYHQETRGCMFDFNGDRDSIVKSIREAMIESDCLKKVRPDLRDAASALVTTLRTRTTQK